MSEENIKKGEAIVNNLSPASRKYVEEYYHKLLSEKITNRIYESAKKHIIAQQVQVLKAQYKDALEKQNSREARNEAYNVLQAKKELILQYCEKNGLDALYIMGRKEHKE